MKENLRQSLSEAEGKARSSSLQQEVDLSEVTQQETKANQQGYGIYKLKQKNKALFCQAIQENLDIVIQSKHLTNSELGLLLSLMPLVQFHSNAIINRETNEFMSISEIARYLNRERTATSKTVSRLLAKGMLFEFVNAQEIKVHKRSVSQRPLFMNPEIIYAGDRNRINATLARLVMEFDILERKKVYLAWKLWLKNGHEFGRLYRRKTYLQFKRHE
ncbi:MarR family transcriptional regulator [Lentibacillus cibarius]|uniref:MarR family transcriptional regulator n=1 Tax=Lentibacillus cibarius TaxID=2583219 RepID=A0A5S3QG06_9BACI|nr:helix-turn-helix domain-containing protein [Lentibacillus cibarius]TMN20864.1 MarR family transcriptional regulator [Lentibacillus cibarius]